MSTRYAPAERLLALGLALAEARGGLTLDQMAELLGVTRRTAERLRDSLHRLADLLAATGVVVRPGPQETISPDLAAELREAVLACHEVRLVYRRRDTGTLSYPILHPYGFLTGSRAYLVGFNPHPNVREYRLYAIANIARLRLTGASFTRDETFDLSAYAARSFGAFWDGEVFDVLWRFSQEVAADARSFRFHPQQEVTTDDDGSVTVAFRASGLTEMAWHLFTWGEHVEILAPPALKERYRACLNDAAAALAHADG